METDGRFMAVLGARDGKAACCADGTLEKSLAVERIYILNTGEARVEDASIYSPGVDVGKPRSLSCNAYLIRREGAWLLWTPVSRTGWRRQTASLPQAPQWIE